MHSRIKTRYFYIVRFILVVMLSFFFACCCFIVARVWVFFLALQCVNDIRRKEKNKRRVANDRNEKKKNGRKKQNLNKVNIVQICAQRTLSSQHNASYAHTPTNVLSYFSPAFCVHFLYSLSRFSFSFCRSPPARDALYAVFKRPKV